MARKLERNKEKEQELKKDNDKMQEDIIKYDKGKKS